MKEERSINCLYQIFQSYTQLTLFVWLQAVRFALYCDGLFAVPVLHSDVASSDWMKWNVNRSEWRVLCFVR
jgi:hypothetical protein